MSSRTPRRRVASLLLASALAIPAALSAPVSARPAQAPSPVATSAGRIVDADGRVVITHGVNLVAKHAPYTPASLGFGPADADLLAAEGFDSVRLGIIWKAIEPEPGRYDDAYLASIRDTSRLLTDRGIRVLLDSHQDLYNERFQGEFAPDWAVTVNWPAEPRLGFPGNQFFQPALMRQYEEFLANAPGPGGVGLVDRYAAMWGHVAGFFADEPGLLGYDLLNEPWPGFGWFGCFTEALCTDQNRRLGDLHTTSARAIRAADPRTLVFHEPFSTSNPGAQVNAPAPGVPGQALSFHSYCIPAIQFGIDLGCDAMTEHTITVAQERAARDGAPVLLTEFGAKRNPATVLPVLRASERRMVGWQYWAYCDCGDPTTSGTGEQGIVPWAGAGNPSETADHAKLDALVTPHPRAISGTPESYGFTPGTGDFFLNWHSSRVDGSGEFGPGARTIVAVPHRSYPQGYRVQVEGGTVLSPPGASELIVQAERPGRLSLRLSR